MKLTGNIGGCDVELDKPDTMLQDGQWWEPVKLRLPKKDEMSISVGSKTMEKIPCDYFYQETWIMSPIPTPTAEQLAAIGKVTGKEPVECKAGNTIWSNIGFMLLRDMDVHMIGKHRFVLEDAPVVKSIPQEKIKCDGCANKNCSDPSPYANCDFIPKPPAPSDKGTVHTSCEGCWYRIHDRNNCPCATCYGENVLEERKNWTTTPQPAPVDDEMCDVSCCAFYDTNTEQNCSGELGGEPAIATCKRRKQPAPGEKGAARTSCEGCGDEHSKPDERRRCYCCQRDSGSALVLTHWWNGSTPAPQPAPLRNEGELCRDCDNRGGCEDYKYGREMACSDFGFVKEPPTPPPAPVEVRIERVITCPECHTRLKWDGDSPMYCDECAHQFVVQETPAPDVTLIGDLEPCSCGSIELSCNGHNIGCDICGAEGPAVYPIPDGNTAKKMWNNRAKQPAPRAFTVEEIERIKHWLSQFIMTNRIEWVQSKLNDPQFGINAVTGKGG